MYFVIRGAYPRNGFWTRRLIFFFIKATLANGSLAQITADGPQFLYTCLLFICLFCCSLFFCSIAFSLCTTTLSLFHLSVQLCINPQIALRSSRKKQMTIQAKESICCITNLSKNMFCYRQRIRPPAVSTGNKSHAKTREYAQYRQIYYSTFY